MKVLVTGGAGFIGSHLVDELINRGHEVILIDDLSAGKRENVNPRAKFFKLSMISPQLEKVLRREKPKIIFHHAAQANVRKSVENIIFDADTNIIGTINLLDCCIKYDVEKIVYASSGGAVYGEPQRLPVDETHPTKPLSPYGLSKLVGERYIELYNELYGLAYVILRYSNVYGPRQDPAGEAGVISIFADAMIKGKKPIIFGDGGQTRDFVYVKDVVRANLIAMKREEGIFNIGSGEEISINELAEEICRVLNVDTKPIYDKPKKGEVRRIYLDTSKAKKELGWEAKVGLKEGLSKTIEWIRKR